MAVTAEAGPNTLPSQHEMYAELQIAGSYAACVIARRCAKAAYSTRKRSMVAGDLLEHVCCPYVMYAAHTSHNPQPSVGGMLPLRHRGWGVVRGVLIIMIVIVCL